LENIDQVKGLKLTAQGNLPRKVVSLIFDIPLPGKDEYRYKPLNVPNEKDYLPSAMANALLIISKTVSVRNNKLFLSALGKKIIKDNHLLFRTLLDAFVTKYNKGYFDFYGDNGIGNVGILYVIYLLKKFGKDFRPAEFYSDLYFRAFPTLVDQVGQYSSIDSRTEANHCFILRVLRSGLNYFGLIEMVSLQGKDFSHTFQVRASPEFYQMFEIKFY